MSSSRLPGKVLAPVLGEPMIVRQVERLRRSAKIDRLVVATSTDPSDDPIIDVCDHLGLSAFRGDLNDVLGRFAGVLSDNPGACAVVRLTADCPLADWRVIDELIGRFVTAEADYASTNLPGRTFPHGLDAEVVRSDALLRAHREAVDSYEREHVTPFVYRRPDLFKLVGLSRSPPLNHLRWTVDYPEDLAFVRQVYEQLYPLNPDFGADEIAALPINTSRGGQ